MLLLIGFPPILLCLRVLYPHSLFNLFKISGGVYKPDSIKSHAFRISGNRSGSLWIVLLPFSAYLSFMYPGFAPLGSQPFSALVFRPLLTSTLNFDEEY